MVDGLLIDIFGAFLVGLEDDVGTSVFQGVFQRGVLAAAEVLRDVFRASDDTGKAEAGLGVGSDIIGEIFGIFAIADNNDTESGAAVALHGEAADPADRATEETKKNEAGEGGVDSHNTDWEKVHIKEEVTSDDGHHADNRGKKKTTDFTPTTAAEKNGLAIEAGGGEDDKVDWNHDEHGEEELARISLKVKGALVKMCAHKIGRQKGQ